MTRPANTLHCIQIAVSLSTLYLFHVYGSLSGWWSKTYSESIELQARGSSFHQVAGGIHVVVLALFALNLASTIVLQQLPCSRFLGRISIICSGLGLAAALLVAF
jgi:hypothetical protein